MTKPQNEPLRAQLQRWREAGLIDGATAAAIRAWEAQQPTSRDPAGTARAQARRTATGLGLPQRLALVLGAVLLAAGLLLFVSAHWDAMAPGSRYGLLLITVVGLHALAAMAGPQLPGLATALHGVGSVALGGGIFLSGQIFHIEARWPAGLLLWALGCGIGWWWLRQWPQLLLLVLLLPAWLAGEWLLLCERISGGAAAAMPAAGLVLLAGLVMLCLSELSGARGTGLSPARQVLVWSGGLGLLPAAAGWAAITGLGQGAGAGLPLPVQLLGWGLALGLPLLLGWWLRRRQAWPLLVAGGWLLLHQLQPWPALLHYGWWALGGVLLSLWGSRDQRAERINLGAVLVACSLIGFYFSEVMSKLDRSISLVGLGLLFLLGGWLLERWRRRLMPSGRADVRGETP